MIDLTGYYTADKAITDTKAAIEKRAEDTFYSNLEKYAEEFCVVMTDIRARAAKGFDTAEFTPVQDYAEYADSGSIPPESARKFSAGYAIIFNILPTLGYQVQKKGYDLYRTDANPFIDKPICNIEYYLVTWKQ